MTKIELVGPSEALRADWQRLYDGYSTFYKRQLADQVADAVWGWIADRAG